MTSKNRTLQLFGVTASFAEQAAGKAATHLGESVTLHAEDAHGWIVMKANGDKCRVFREDADVCKLRRRFQLP